MTADQGAGESRKDPGTYATAANGRLSVVECYVLGLDPANETNDFKIVSFPMGADGKPDLEHIVFEPAENKWNVQGARAVLKGAEMVDGMWNEVDKASEEDRAKRPRPADAARPEAAPYRAVASARRPYQSERIGIGQWWGEPSQVSSGSPGTARPTLRPARRAGPTTAGTAALHKVALPTFHVFDAWVWFCYAMPRLFHY